MRFLVLTRSKSLEFAAAVAVGCDIAVRCVQKAPVAYNSRILAQSANCGPQKPVLIALIKFVPQRILSVLEGLLGRGALAKRL